MRDIRIGDKVKLSGYGEGVTGRVSRIFAPEKLGGTRSILVPGTKLGDIRTWIGNAKVI